VKDALWVQSGLVVTVDDVIKRAERLVGAGIINKILRKNESFRSIAYCYFDEEDTYPSTYGVSEMSTPIRESNTPEGTTKNTTKHHPDKNLSVVAVGEDLYHQLRSTLNIKRLPDNVAGISKQLFIQKFLQWMSLTPCSYVCNKTHNHTKIFDDNHKDNNKDNNNKNNLIFPSPPGISKFESPDDGIETTDLSLDSLSMLFSRLFFTAKIQLEALVRQKKGSICLFTCVCKYMDISTNI
jgi:hypothetical protein